MSTKEFKEAAVSAKQAKTKPLLGACPPLYHAPLLVSSSPVIISLLLSPSLTAATTRQKTVSTFQPTTRTQRALSRTPRPAWLRHQYMYHMNSLTVSTIAKVNEYIDVSIVTSSPCSCSCRTVGRLPFRCAVVVGPDR
jgi:hypothetical protein